MNHSLRLIILLLVALFFESVNAQEIIELFPEKSSNSDISEGHNKETRNSTGLIAKVISPTLEMYLPSDADSLCPAVIICPGGGYSVIVYEGEGVSTAKKMAANGIAAFVLKYRLPESTKNNKNIPLQDAQQAMKTVREHASEFNINPDRIGIMGFSAGGHLASTLATHYKPLIANEKNTSLRPDFHILIYPVISMQDSLTHPGSRTQLLGDNPSPEDIHNFSSELQVSKNTPPAYITHATDDTVVDVDNSILYFQQLRHHNVPVEMHIYQKGNHGFVFNNETWTEPLFQWLKTSGFLVN